MKSGATIFGAFLFFSASSFAGLYWQDGAVVESHAVSGSVEENGDKRAICRGVEGTRTYVGKLVGNSCRASSGKGRKDYKVLLDFSVLHADSPEDYEWVNRKDFRSGSMNLFDASVEGAQHPVTICRATKIHYKFRVIGDGEVKIRGDHTGRVYGTVKDGSCYFEWGTKVDFAPNTIKELAAENYGLSENVIKDFEVLTTK